MCKKEVIIELRDVILNANPKEKVIGWVCVEKGTIETGKFIELKLKENESVHQAAHRIFEEYKIPKLPN